MSISIIRQKRARTGVRSTFGLVLVAMLGLAFQPCVMAMDVDTDHPCPHCPTGATQMQHHQDPQLEKVADCDYVDIYSHDSRSAQSKADGSLEDLPILVDNVFSLDVPGFVPDDAYERASPLADHSSGPPLNILYCIYLK